MKIAKEALPYLNFSEEDQKIIIQLVKDHDVFISLTIDENKKGTLLSTDLLEKMKEDYDILGDGKKILSFLIKVGISDNHAQNTALTQGTLKLIETMGKMVDELDTQNTIDG